MQKNPVILQKTFVKFAYEYQETFKRELSNPLYLSYEEVYDEHYDDYVKPVFRRLYNELNSFFEEKVDEYETAYLGFKSKFDTEILKYFHSFSKKDKGCCENDIRIHGCSIRR